MLNEYNVMNKVFSSPSLGNQRNDKHFNQESSTTSPTIILSPNSLGSIDILSQSNLIPLHNVFEIRAATHMLSKKHSFHKHHGRLPVDGVSLYYKVFHHWGQKDKIQNQRQSSFNMWLLINEIPGSQSDKA